MGYRRRRMLYFLDSVQLHFGPLGTWIILIRLGLHVADDSRVGGT